MLKLNAWFVYASPSEALCQLYEPYRASPSLGGDDPPPTSPDPGLQYGNASPGAEVCCVICEGEQAVKVCAEGEIDVTSVMPN